MYLLFICRDLDINTLILLNHVVKLYFTRLINYRFVRRKQKQK